MLLSQFYKKKSMDIGPEYMNLIDFNLLKLILVSELFRILRILRKSEIITPKKAFFESKFTNLATLYGLQLST